MSKNFINNTLVFFLFISRVICRLIFHSIKYFRLLILANIKTCSFVYIFPFSFYEEFVLVGSKEIVQDDLRYYLLCYLKEFLHQLLASIEKISINISNQDVVLVGDAICGIREIE